jgi:hypothetical protein
MEIWKKAVYVYYTVNVFEIPNYHLRLRIRKVL